MTAWHRKAADYYRDVPNGTFAFVSTNSICQGQPVAAMFKPLFEEGWRISYAWPTFVWMSEALDKAHVHVVIVGMDRQDGKARLFGDDGMREVDNINPYLAAAPTFYIDKRSTPLSPDLKPALYGEKPADGGYLQLKKREDFDAAMADPLAAKYVRRSLGATELINAKERWCLWLVDATDEDIVTSPFLFERVDACRAWRLKSKKKQTKDAAKTPQETAAVIRAFKILSKNAGIFGMVGGQCADLEAENREVPITDGQLEYIHSHKTACMIESGFEIGAILAGAPDSDVEKLGKIAENIGIAFQIQDDILDVIGDSEELGKLTGSDEKDGKVTYVTMHGLDKSAEDVRRMSEEALELFDSLTVSNDFLRELIVGLITRTK